MRTLIGLLASLFFAASAAAESRTALVIGNAAYATAPLANPVNDAKDIGAALASLGFEVEIATDLDQREMKKSVLLLTTYSDDDPHSQEDDKMRREAERRLAMLSRKERVPGSGSFPEIDAFIATRSIDKSEAGWKTRLDRPPKMRFQGDRTYIWLLETNVGNIKIKLFPDVAPMHVSSTIYLTRLGFYDETRFHRVIDGFMAQGGDPLGSGRGGPGYRYDGEYSRRVRHDRPGMLSMANAGPGTDGSQFFITFVPTPHLDGNHTIFGEVVEGMETVNALERRGSRDGRTTENLYIERASVFVE